MSKSETMKQLAAASNAARLDDLGQRIESLRAARIESAEQLAAILEPLAEAMAALTDETRATLVTIQRQAREQGDRARVEVETMVKASQITVGHAYEAVTRLEETGRQLELRHYLLAVATGAATALLVSALWLWLFPPVVVNRLDVKEIVNQLRPEIAALKPSKGK